MELVERTKKEKKEYNRQKKLEILKKKCTLLKAKLFNKKISPEDSRTIQVHRDSEGILRDYYISNAYLQNGISFLCVNPIIEDNKNNRFVYRGIVRGADNAIGVIEANIPLSEIVASPDGNVKLQEMLSQEYATEARIQYYEAIREEQSPLDNHSTYFGKPDFVLGTILKGEKGGFSFSNNVSSEVEEILFQEREIEKKEKLMRDKDSVKIDIGGGMVISEVDCWLEQKNGIRFAGINNDALFYEYSPKGKAISTDDDKYVYIGETKIGETTTFEVRPGEPIQIINPFIYQDIILWTDRKNLIQYFLDKKFDGLNFALGEIFTSGNIKKVTKDRERAFIGGIITDEKGKCREVEDVPESVRKAVEEYMSNKEYNTNSNIIDFNDQK